MGLTSSPGGLDLEPPLVVSDPPVPVGPCAHIWRYNYNRTPIAQPSTKVVAHSSVDEQPTFGPHGRLGWYIGPSLEHYRCFKVYCLNTLYKCDLLKADFFPPKIPI